MQIYPIGSYEEMISAKRNTRLLEQGEHAIPWSRLSLGQLEYYRRVNSPHYTDPGLASIRSADLR